MVVVVAINSLARLHLMKIYEVVQSKIRTIILFSFGDVVTLQFVGCSSVSMSHHLRPTLGYSRLRSQERDVGRGQTGVSLLPSWFSNESYREIKITFLLVYLGVFLPY